MFVEQIKLEKQIKKSNNHLLKVNNVLKKSEAQKTTNTLQHFLKNL